MNNVLITCLSRSENQFTGFTPPSFCGGQRNQFPIESNAVCQPDRYFLLQGKLYLERGRACIESKVEPVPVGNTAIVNSIHFAGTIVSEPHYWYSSYQKKRCSCWLRYGTKDGESFMLIFRQPRHIEIAEAWHKEKTPITGIATIAMNGTHYGLFVSTCHPIYRLTSNSSLQASTF